MPDNTNRPPQWPNGEINVPHRIADAVSIELSEGRFIYRDVAGSIIAYSCYFCGSLLRPSDTYCCPKCGWKVGAK